MKPSELDQLNKSKNMSLDLSLDKLMPDYSKGVTLTAPKLWFQVLKKMSTYLISSATRGEGGGREEKGIAVVCFQATNEERQRSPHIRKLLKWIHS